MEIRKIPLASIKAPAWGWHLESGSIEHKLEMSLSRFGQLKPLTVNTTEVEGEYHIIDGRHVLHAMKRLGWTEAVCAILNAENDIEIALALALTHDVDYVKLAGWVAPLEDDIVSTAPFSGVSLRHYRTLAAGFDWSQFDGGVEQTTFFDDEEDAMGVQDIRGHYDTAADGDVPLEPVTVPEEPLPPTPPKGRAPKAKPAPPPAAPRPRIPELLEIAPAPPRASAPNGGARLGALLSFDNPQDAVPSATGASRSGDQDQAPSVLFPEGPASLLDAPTRSNPLDTGGGALTVLDKSRLFLSGIERAESTWTPQAPPSLDGITELDFDTETNGTQYWKGHRPIGISIHYGEPGRGHKQYLPWGHAGGNLDEAVVKEWARRELRGKKLYGANIRFDVHMMREWGIDLEAQGCTYGDVQHQVALLDEYRFKFNLAGLCEDFLPELRKTGEDLDKSRMATYHAGDVAPYAETDAEAVGHLRAIFRPQLEAQDLLRVLALEEKVIHVVVEMEKNAAFIDRIRLKQWVQRSRDLMNEYLWTLTNELGFAMNPEKNADWQRLFNHFGIPIEHFTETMAPSFDDEVLANVNHEFVQLARRAGKLSSLRSKFLQAYDEVVGEDCKLRFALHQLRGDDYGTIRGRFSMSGGSKDEPNFGANLQQVFSAERQREAFGIDGDDTSYDQDIFLIRALFIPEDGIYGSSDAQSIEYRLAAHYARSKALLDAYESDWAKIRNPALQDGTWVDFHKVVQDMVATKKKISRKTTKNLNFMKIYGGGRDKAAKTLKMDRSESDPLIDLYDQMFPEFKTLLDDVRKLAETRGYVRTIAGRRARFPGDKKKFAHKAINYVIQGSAADIMKQKLVELHAERHNTGFVMRQTVHDEVDGDFTTEDTQAKVQEILNRQTFDTKVPIVWQVKSGANWSQC